MRKVYSKCYAFRGVFHEKILEIPAICEIRKVYSRPYEAQYKKIKTDEITDNKFCEKNNQSVKKNLKTLGKPARKFLSKPE